MNFTKLFDVQNGVVIPTEHCYTLKALKDVMDEYPDDYLKIYMEKEMMIMDQIGGEFSTEDETVFVALQFCQRMYETPTSRAYKGIASMLDRLGRYMENTPITHGRDGNFNSLIAAAKNYEAIRQSFKGAYKDLQEEQSSKVRGGQGLAYDM
jgi:hypothetical protein